jgi:hypothetical protein
MARTSASGGIRGGFSAVDTNRSFAGHSNIGARQAFCRALADASARQQRAENYSSASSTVTMSQPKKAFINAKRTVPRHDAPLRYAASIEKMNNNTTLTFSATV